MTMDTSTQPLAYYESISELSHLMLCAARLGDWDALVDAEQSCAALIRKLQSAGDVSAMLDEGQRRRKHEIILKVLDDDAQIRNLTQPWLRQLEVHLGQTRLARNVANAYRT